MYTLVTNKTSRLELEQKSSELLLFHICGKSKTVSKNENHLTLFLCLFNIHADRSSHEFHFALERSPHGEALAFCIAHEGFTKYSRD